MTPSPATSRSKARTFFRARAVRELEEPVYTLRAVSATISFWIIAALLAIALISAVAGGQFDVVLFTAPVASFLVWLIFVLLLAPGVTYNSKGVVIVNFARVHVVPWAMIARIEQRIDLLFTLHDGTKIHAFGSPYPKRGNALFQTKPQVSGRNYDGDVSILEDFRRNAVDAAAVATHRWSLSTLLVGLILGIACVGVLVVGGLVA